MPSKSEIAKLRATAKNLIPLGIYLRDSKIFVHQKFNRYTCQEKPYDIQTKGNPGVEFELLLSEDKSEGIVAFRFQAGVRLVDSSLDSSSSDFVKLEIEANYQAEYQIVDMKKFDDDGASIFLGMNVPHHVWPYWREYVQSTTVRMGIPALIIPFRIIEDIKEEEKNND